MSDTRSRIDLEVSRRFDVLKLLLMVLVIMIHAEKGIFAYVPEPPAAAQAVILFFGHNLCRAAVPLFFTISGYLLFTSFKPGLDSYLVFLRKKFKTIAVPYLFFNLLCFALIFAFDKIPYIGDVNGVLNKGFLNLLLGVGTFPINYTLWFLRDLMVYLVLAPAFFVVAEEIPRVGLLAWYLLWNFVQQDGVFLELSGAFFFYLGCFLAKTGFGLKGFPRRPALVYAAYFVLACLGVFLEYRKDLGMWFFLAHRFNLVLGVCAFWSLSALPALRDNATLLRLSGYSFFIYLVHEPILSYLIYATRYLFEFYRPGGAFGTVFYFFLLTGLTFALALALGMLVSRRLPRLFAFATGSRAPRPSLAEKAA